MVVGVGESGFESVEVGGWGRGGGAKKTTKKLRTMSRSHTH